MISIPVAMVAYTGIETISNMAEEAIDPPRHVPRSIMYVVLAVFAIYAFLPSVALSALPVQPATQQMVATSPSYQCTASTGTCRSADHATWPAGMPATRWPGWSLDHLGLPDTITSGLGFYVAILAATILIIATNAGIIGVSRLTYSMGQHRQLPEAIRRVHPKYNTPYVAILLYSVIAILLMMPPGAISFLGNLYAFGAMLSFTLAHALRGVDDDTRCRGRGPALAGAIVVARTRLRLPTFAHPGRHRHLRLVAGHDVPALTDEVAAVGLIWLMAGHGRVLLYRRTQHLPLTQTVLARALRPGAGARGRVPVDPDADLVRTRVTMR